MLFLFRVMYLTVKLTLVVSWVKTSALTIFLLFEMSYQVRIMILYFVFVALALGIFYEIKKSAGKAGCGGDGGKQVLSFRYIKY